MLKEVFFPYKEVRKTQGIIIKDVLEAFEEKKNFLMHAPTGLGKTVSTLAPLLSRVLDKDLTIFFLTPRHTQHKIAIETLRRIKKKYKVDFTAVDFIGKKWMCPISGTDLLPQAHFYEYCKEVREKETCQPYLNSRTRSIKRLLLLGKLKRKNPLHVEEFCNLCGKEFCPFEVSCLMAKKAKVIIADYHHILSSSIRDSLFKKINKNLQNSVIIFDESQNLPKKARDLLTVDLTTYVLDKAIKEAKTFNFRTEEIKNIGKLLLGLCKKIPEGKTEVLVEKEEFKVDTSIVEELILMSEEILEKKKRSFIMSVANFLEAWRGFDYGFARILTRGFYNSGKSFVSLSYRCLDPSMLTKPIIENSRFVVCMSGTLKPLDFYQDILGFGLCVKKEYENPFPRQNRLNLIVPHTTTKFTRRNDVMFKKISEMLSNLCNLIPGNILVFFPSYQIRDEVNFYFKDLCEKVIFLEQQKLMKKEKEKLLEGFKSCKKNGAVLLGVSAGSFGEGIDLSGDLLKAVIVVGLPLAKPDLETKKLIEYYDEEFQKGWDYGYIYPAMIKCLQNAGRCIRSETDKGVIVFLDERYAWQNYFKCFPKDLTVNITDIPEKKIEEFFRD